MNTHKHLVSMAQFNRKKHWETIYQTKELNTVSWYEPTPETSLRSIEESKLPKNAKIIDIGGGDRLLVDHLLNKGYTDISVLDISEAAIQRAKNRLGTQANSVKWIVADAAEFQPQEHYDFWHDPTAFHFLTDEQDISNYIKTAQQYVSPKGVLVIGTFSEQGPTKCSGIDIKQYSEDSMTQRLKNTFKKLKCITLDHRTPFGTIQNFVFCSFKRIVSS